LPRWQQQFDVSGGPRSGSVVSSHSHERNRTDGRVRDVNHTTWDCKYHVVFIPKSRRKLLFQELRKPLGEVFRQLAAQKEAKVEEGHLLPDHVHILSIPPKYAVSNVVGRDPFGTDLRRTKAQFHGAKFLGARLLCEHGWTRRKGDPGIYPEPREGRPTVGATQSLEVPTTFRWPISAEPR
jgi:REP element-mobilizing transposase RayT